MVLLLELNNEDCVLSLLRSREGFVRAMQMRKLCVENFRAQWYNEYLLIFKERLQGRSSMLLHNSLKVEDVVLIKSILETRHFRGLGRSFRADQRKR